MPALGTPGGSLASGWHGRGALYGWARAELAWGIGPGGRGESGGEVMARAVVGGVMPRVRVLGGDGIAQGRRGVRVHGLCGVGSARRASRMASWDWGSMAVG
jgi:hypothetical protein